MQFKLETKSNSVLTTLDSETLECCRNYLDYEYFYRNTNLIKVMQNKINIETFIQKV